MLISDTPVLSQTGTTDLGVSPRTSPFFRGGARPPTETMTAYIDEHRAEFGVEPICALLPIAPSTYYAATSRPVSKRETISTSQESESALPS